MRKMNKVYFGILLFLSSCMAKHTDANQVQLLKTKLLIAERALRKEQKEIEHLQQELFDAELNLIEMRLTLFEQRWKKEGTAEESSTLFLQEREALHQMIQAGLPRAQMLLDRILQLITQISDTNNS